MKLLMVTPYFYPKIGGMENYAYNISKGLKEKYGWEVVVVTSNNEEKKYKVEIINGLKIYRLPAWFKISNTPINPLWYFQIKKIIRKEKPDIINGHTPVPFISDISERVKGDIPFVLTYQNDLVKNNYILNTIIHLYYKVIGNFTLKATKKIIASSSYYAKNSPYLRKHLNKVFIVTPGVDINLFNKTYNKLIINKFKKNQVVLFVGQLDKTHIHKGLTYLIDAIANLSEKIANIKLVIVGKGDYLNYYKEYARSKSILPKTIFTGFIKDADLPNYYKSANVLVLPSYDQSEGFGITLIEAFACKKPVIGTRVGGIPYVINHNKNGLLVKPKNSEQLAKAISKILSDEKIAKRYGENGFEKVKKDFRWNNKIQLTDSLFKAVIKKHVIDKSLI